MWYEITMYPDSDCNGSEKVPEGMGITDSTFEIVVTGTQHERAVRVLTT